MPIMNEMAKAIAELKEAGEPEQPAELGIFKMDDDPISPRGWLLGNAFCRSYLSSIIADGGAGKTALRIAQCLSLAMSTKWAVPLVTQIAGAAQAP